MIGSVICTSNVLGISLALMNIVSLAIGAVVIWLGVLIRMNPTELFNKILPNLTRMMQAGGVDLKPENWLDDLTKVLDHKVGLALIILGCVTVIVSVVGLVAGICQWNGMLVPYCIVMFVLCFAMVTVTCLFGVQEDLVRTSLGHLEMNFFQNDYQLMEREKDATGFTHFWNLIQRELQCCGVENYGDFAKIKGYQPQRLTVPSSCCKQPNSDCVAQPTQETANLAIGCEAKIWQSIQTTYTKALIGMSLICVFLAVPLLFALTLICIHKSNDKMVDY